MFHPFLVQNQLVLPISSVRALLFFWAIFFRLWFSQTLCFLVWHGIEPSEQVVPIRRQVRYSVLQRLCYQGVYPKSIETRLARRWICRGMRSTCLKGELYFVSLALNTRSRRFELRGGATSAIVRFRQVCSVSRRHLSEVWLRDRRNYYLRWGLYWRDFLIAKVDSAYSV